MTFVIAVGAIFTLPDDPLHTRWLTQEERELAHARIQRDTVGSKASSVLSIRSSKEQDNGEYKMSGV